LNFNVLIRLKELFMAFLISAGAGAGGVLSGFVGGIITNGLGTHIIDYCVPSKLRKFSTLGGIAGNILLLTLLVPGVSSYSQGMRIGIVAAGVLSSAIKPVNPDKKGNVTKKHFEWFIKGGTAGCLAAAVGCMIGGATFAIFSGGIAAHKIASMGGFTNPAQTQARSLIEHTTKIPNRQR
jgi:hypothetical protein